MGVGVWTAADTGGQARTFYYAAASSSRVTAIMKSRLVSSHREMSLQDTSAPAVGSEDTSALAAGSKRIKAFSAV